MTWILYEFTAAWKIQFFGFFFFQKSFSLIQLKSSRTPKNQNSEKWSFVTLITQWPLDNRAPVGRVCYPRLIKTLITERRLTRRVEKIKYGNEKKRGREARKKFEQTKWIIDRALPPQAGGVINGETPKLRSNR